MGTFLHRDSIYPASAVLKTQMLEPGTPPTDAGNEPGMSTHFPETLYRLQLSRQSIFGSIT